MKMDRKTLLITMPLLGVVFVVLMYYACCPSPRHIKPQNDSLKKLVELLDSGAELAGKDLETARALTEDIIRPENFRDPDIIADIIYAYPRFQNDLPRKTFLAKLLVYLGAEKAIPLFEKDSTLPVELAAAYIGELKEVVAVADELGKLSGQAKAKRAVDILGRPLKYNAGKRHIKYELIRLRNGSLPAMKDALARQEFPENELLISVLRNINTPEADALLPKK